MEANIWLSVHQGDRCEACMRRLPSMPCCWSRHFMSAPELPHGCAVNYLHWGDAKRWYAVPGSAAGAFERAFQRVLPAKFEQQPNLLLQLITMLSPRVLQKLGIPLHATTQACPPRPLCQDCVD